MTKTAGKMLELACESSLYVVKYVYIPVIAFILSGVKFDQV